MVEFNMFKGHVMCCIDTETTGLVPNYNEISQVCILPLNNSFNPHPRIEPFQVLIQPDYPERIESAALKKQNRTLDDLMSNGVDSYTAGEMFIEWFEKLQLLPNKRLMPLAQNWPFDRPFLQEWLGPENFNERVDGRYRDLMTVAVFVHDSLNYGGVERIKFENLRLNTIAKVLGVEFDYTLAHDAYYDCVKTAECYKAFVEKFNEGKVCP